MSKQLLTLALATLGATAALAQADSLSRVFIYSPDERAGLHIALQQADGSWHDEGQLCASDYGPWGSAKRMYHPSVARAADGTWRLVFQLSDHTPQLGVAYSRDLVEWRPQDYPVMSVPKCLDPVVFEAADGTFDVYFRSPEGKRWTQATPNFRHFTPDRASQVGDDAWLRDTATVGGRLHEGNTFDLAPHDWQRIAAYMAGRRADAALSAERMHDDGKPGSPVSRLAADGRPLAVTLTVDTSQPKAISPCLMGVFFEDISYAADGGLYAELVQNRDFEYSARDRSGWTATTAWHSPRPVSIATEDPLSAANPHYALVRADSLVNEGWDGIAVTRGEKYDFSMFVRGRKRFSIQLLAADGRVLAKTRLTTKADVWQQYGTTLTAKGTDAHARLLVLPEGDAEVAVDMVSLFPRATFMERRNGLRRDLAQAIADLRPKFIRFPGGCMSHGQGIDNIYHWHETIGPLQDRKPDFNTWHYHQTRGLGFYEYFQFCEDIGAEPLPVLAAGVPCQNSGPDARGLCGQQGGIPMDQMPAYIDELLHLIEWANGDPATSQWARRRAEAGHPAPFNLKYIGIGNEDIISTTFEERYAMIARAIRTRYPDIKVCGTVGPFHAPSADYLEGWDFTRRHPDLQFMVDEHYYESTGWFMHHRDYYDRYDRRQAKVYLGEWAASTRTKRPNVETALAEALYLTDIERNGDVVWMTSYAPLLARDGHHNWDPDMIYFSGTEVRLTPAYHVQRLFSVYGGDRYLPSRFTGLPADVAHRVGASVVSDAQTGRTCLKLVNALPVPIELTISGLDIPAGSTAEGFEGRPEEQHLEVKAADAGNGGRLTLPPYSMRAIELHPKD